MATPKILNVFIGTDGRIRPILRALLYASLAFWLLSADWLLGPVIGRVAKALHVSGLSAGAIAFYETINLLTALLLTWLFGRYEGLAILRHPAVEQGR
jgi:predicted MFS family arabinose efflux permease